MRQISLLIITMMALMSFQTTNKSKAKPKLPENIATVIERGKAVYIQHCLSCHQVDGGGVPHLNAPLDGATDVVGNDKAKIIRIVLKGMSDRIELDGEYYSNNMASHKELSDQQIADVLTYIRNSWTNKASSVSASEVKQVRLKLK